MIKTLGALLQRARDVGPLTISVAVAQDLDVLEAVDKARKEGICKAILVGAKKGIEDEAKRGGIELKDYEVVDIEDDAEASLEAVRLVSSGKASLLMKGMVKTATFLKAVLNKEVGLRTGNLLSHVYLHEIDGYDHIIFITDGAMNIAPDLKQKAQIIENAALLAKRAFGVTVPKVAVLAAVEVVNPDMPATVDGAALSKMADRKQIKGVEVDGPLALDNAVSEVAARHKGIESSVAGRADILLVPDIEAGNVMAKAVVYFAKPKTAGIVVGAKAPIVLTSRADSPETKLYSIATAVSMAAGGLHE